MRHFSFAFLRLVATAGCLAVPGIAWADDLITIADPDIVLDVAKGYGSANLSKDSDGNPMISGRMETVKYSVFFYGCQDGTNCRSVQFSTGYTDAFSNDKANEWNTKYRWVKSYADNGSNFRMDVDFKGGISRQNLDAQFETFNSLIIDIRDFVTN